MIDILRHLFRRRRDSTSVEENLRRYIGVSDTIISIGLFGTIFYTKLNIVEYFGTDDNLEIVSSAMEGEFWIRLRRFAEDQWVYIIFSLVIYGWFFLYKRAVKNEMEILVQLYSRFNPPHDWENLLGQKWIPVLSVGITCTFLALAYFIDNLAPFCAIMLLLNVLDARGNNLIRQNLSRHFRDPAYVPLDNDLHKKFIMRRRDVAERYWIWKPQIERVGLMMIGVNLAFVAAYSDEIFGVPIWKEVPIAILVATILLNEYTMGSWRIERDRDLERIDHEQEEEDRARTRA